MVCEALVSSQAWRQLPSVERSLLFAAALLHDVAKPDCTSVDEDGRISSKGHVRQGARVARQILWQLDMPVPFQDRERVVALVQHGGLPIWFLEKPNPQRTVIRASQVIQCELLAQLAEADVRGRHCHDQQELLDRIELFREFCQENDCLHSPRQFPSAHSRFVYFRKEDGDPNYAAYDDTQFEVVLMSGLPGVGKDHWIAENLPDLPVISLDALRRQMNISPYDDQGVVANQAKAIARDYMRAGRSFVWNATNTTRSMRSLLIDFFAAYQARIRFDAVFFKLLLCHRLG
jgi:putative nucleotidyltransferase with HDIG domain